MALIVPHERRDPVALFYPECAQRLGETLGALGHLEKRRLVHALGRHREDLLV